MPKQKLIITISGSPGSGKSTVAKKLAQALDAKRIYVGQIRRDLARKKGMTLEELNEYALTHPETDVDVDNEVAQEAKNLAKDNLVIVEGRTQFHFIPESFKIYVKVDLNEGAKRIWNQMQDEAAKNKRNEAIINSFDELVKDIKKRGNNDIQRYKKYYNIDHTDESQYDLIVDTTNITADEATEIVLNKVNPLTKPNK
ncbi:(d)CMP kinase [Patescibacteria group bacterium]